MKRTPNSLFAQVAGLALAVLCTTSSPSAELAQKARDLLAQSKDSLITVTSLSKMDMGAMGLPIRLGGLGESQEASCGGLVIDPSGLTVVSYSALNPMEKIAGALKIKISEDSEELKTKTELSRLQMRLPDGTEVPARLVLKDKELDLAFLLPDPKQGDKLPQFTPVKLASPTAQELDDVVVISRHSKDLGYQPTVTVGHVTSVIRKPRAMYDLSTASQPGSPVYLPDGQLLGVTVGFGGDGASLMSMGAMEVLVLPAADITKLAEQARKAAEKKPAKE
jgi:S1-C subfamily serine protease